MEAEVLQKKKTLAPKLRFKEFSSEWKTKNIGSVLTIGSGKDYKHLGNGSVPVFGTGGLMTTVDKFLYDGATVCIGRKGTIDKPMYFEGKLWTVDTLFYTHSFLESTPKFVFNLFQKINWKEHNEASGVPSLSKATIEKIKISIPALPEQQKIASFLSAVDEKIKQLTRKKELLEQYKKGVMQQLFSGTLRFKDENGKAFPKWEEKRLGDVCDVIDSLHITPKLYVDNGFPMIRVTDVNDEKLELDKCLTVSEEDFKDFTKKHQPKFGDIILSRVGTCGASVKLSTNDKVCLGQNTVLLIPKIKNDFLHLMVRSDLIQKQVKNKVVGSTQKTLSLTDLRKFKVVNPSVEEQKKIADYLSNIDNKIESVTKQITQTQTFKKGLLQQMFV